MYIDVVHLLLAACGMVMLLSTVMLLMWWQDRGAEWLGWMGALFVFGGASLILLLLDGVLPRPVSLGIGTATFVFAFHLVWTAARVAEGRRPLWWPVGLALGAWGALCLVPGMLDSLLVPVVVHGVLGSIGIGLGAWELWRGRAAGPASRWALIVLFTTVSVAFAARLPFVALMPFPFGGLPADMGWLATFVMSLVIAATLLAILAILFAKGRAEQELRRFALTDALTGLPNRRAFGVDIAKAARRHLGAQREYCLAMLDLDHFKAINDRFGHDCGDEVLKRFAEAMRHRLRPGDTLYRLGGEEFCCILPQTGVQEAERIADAMRFAFRSIVHSVRTEKITATVSIGVATSRLAGADPASVQAMADAALYRAKRLGRDRVAVGLEAPLPEQDVEWIAA